MKELEFEDRTCCSLQIPVMLAFFPFPKCTVLFLTCQHACMLFPLPETLLPFYQHITTPIHPYTHTCSTWGSQKVRHDLATEQQKYVCIGENSIYGVWYSLRLQASTEGLRTYTPCIRGNYFIYFLYLFLFFYILLMHCEL